MFHSIGSTPSLSELLKIAVNGGARRFAWFLNTHAVMLPCQVALFVKIYYIRLSHSDPAVPL